MSTLHLHPDHVHEEDVTVPPTPPIKTDLEIVDDAIALIERGWTVNCGARRADYTEINPRSASAVSFCLIGAFVRAIHDGTPEDEVKWPESNSLSLYVGANRPEVFDAIGDEARETYRALPMETNDEYFHGHEDAVRFLQRVKERLR